jgi:hypothetical protein
MPKSPRPAAGGAMPAVSQSTRAFTWPKREDWTAPPASTKPDDQTGGGVQSFALTVAALADAADAAALAEKASIAHSPYLSGLGPRAYELATCGGCRVDESFTVPPTDGLTLSSREKRLAELGWRLIAVPRIVKRQNGPSNSFTARLEWEGRSWLIVPPEEKGISARSFDKKGPAIGWAEAQA